MIDRTAISLLLSVITFALTVIWGAPLIRVLRSLKAGDNIRVELPDRYLAKMGTPTMGGVMFIVPTIIVTVVFNAVTLLGGRPAGRSILMPLGTMALFAVLGALDDWTKLRRREAGEGLKARYKFMIQVLLAAVIAVGLYMVLSPTP